MAAARALPLLLAGVVGRAPAQVATHLLRLRAEEAPQREDARRRLALLPRADLPVAELLALVRAGGDAAAPAADVLVRHADLRETLRRSVDVARAPADLVAVLLPVLDQAQLWEQVASSLAEPALAELARRHRLDAEALVEVLQREGPRAPAAFAAELLVHGEPPSPPVLDAIAAAPAARQRVLRALADHPRHEYVPWLQRWIGGGGDPLATLAAIAALPADVQTQAHAREVLRLMNVETQPFLPDLAAARFSAGIADGLVSGAHAALLEGKAVGDLLPLLTNVSAAGEEHLLGLAVTLPPDECEAVCRWLDTRDSVALSRRIEAALDGSIALDDQWLRRAGASLDSAARTARVAAVLAEGEPRAGLAFEALVEGDRYDPGMLPLLRTPGAGVERARSLLRLPAGVLPVPVACDLLQHEEPSVRLAAVHYLAGPDLAEPALAALRVRLAHDDDERVRGACARSLTAYAADEPAREAFAVAFGSAFGDEAVDWLLARPRPFGLALLQELRAQRSAPREVDDLDTGLVRLGDLRPLPGLLARLGELPPRLVKRLRPVLSTVADPAIVQQLAAAATDAGLGELRREVLVEALAARPEPDVELLRGLLEREEDDGIRAAALHGLLATASGAAMLEQLNARLGQQPLQRADEDLAFEILGAAPLPLSTAVVEFAARLALVAPLASPVPEAELTLSERGVGGDYPLVQPLVELIRRAPRREHGEAIARVVAQARAHRNAHALSRRRLGHLFSYLALAGPAFAAAAPALAEAILDAPDADPTWVGPASLVVGRQLEASGDLAAAADAFAAAFDALLQSPPPVVQRRRFVSDPDPARGSVPMAALAARPALLRARLKLGSGDVAAARTAAQTARARALTDRAAVAECDALLAEIGRSK